MDKIHVAQSRHIMAFLRKAAFLQSAAFLQKLGEGFARQSLAERRTLYQYLGSWASGRLGAVPRVHFNSLGDGIQAPGRCGGRFRPGIVHGVELRHLCWPQARIQ